ncbi:MAG: transcriptional regulator NrdR [Alphaproteobacteria bacterium]|nr:transcriptional regulator NrdR [Alphaproteobacteria bacterium]MDE2336891.1 transcriptional regulator NrdR [Alphaproteobacteria bacterium]
MRCPFCGHEDTQVKDSRPSEDNSAIRRRRECAHCDARFTTFERVQLRDLTVIKVDGRRENFERDKLVRSLKLATRRRPVDLETIERTASEIVRQLEASGEPDVTTKVIGERAMKALAKIDPVAFVRYASVYKDFREVEDYTDFLKKNYKKA